MTKVTSVRSYFLINILVNFTVSKNLSPSNPIANILTSCFEKITPNIATTMHIPTIIF